MTRFRWVGVIFFGAAVGAALYAVGVPSVLVYIIRGVLVHLAYSHGGR
jgi:hypothetical protein